MSSNPLDFSKSNLPTSSDWCATPASTEADHFLTLRELIFPQALLDTDAVSDMELPSLLNALEMNLLERQVRLDFLDRLPARIAYKGLLQLLDTPLPRPRHPLEVLHVDGCDSACESCFQLAYCGLAKEFLGESWHVALEHAGTNPSWTALFGRG